MSIQFSDLEREGFYFLNKEVRTRAAFALWPSGKVINEATIRDRVFTSRDSCTSGTSRVHTVATMQQLKMESLIPASIDFEVRL